LDLNSEQNSMSLNKKYEYQIMTRLILITGSKNKIWIQLVLTRVRDNVPWLSIYILNHYTTLFVAQTISMVVACTSNYLAYTPSCLMVVPCGPIHLYNSGLDLKSIGLGLNLLGLYLKSSKGGFLCHKLLPQPCYNFLEAFRT
jgi:hypothetical protein